MATLLEIEQAIIDRIEVAVPQRRVVGRLGNVRETAALETVAAPEVQVLLSQWEPRSTAPGAGAWQWIVRIVEGAAASPERRRLGRASSGLPEGLFRTLSAVRGALTGVVLAAGHAPLVPVGGSLKSAGNPLMVWEEEFLDAPPIPGHARPVIGGDLDYACLLQSSVAAGLQTFALPPFNVPVDVGYTLVFEFPDRSYSECPGAVTAMAGDVLTFERALSRSFPAGSTVWAMLLAINLVTVPAAGSTRSLDDGTTGEFDLAGGAHRTILRPALHRRRDVYGPMPLADATRLIDVFAQLRFQPRLLLIDAAGQPHAVQLDAAPVARQMGNGMAEFELPLRGQPLTSLLGFEVTNA